MLSTLPYTGRETSSPSSNPHAPEQGWLEFEKQGRLARRNLEAEEMGKVQFEVMVANVLVLYPRSEGSGPADWLKLLKTLGNRVHAN